MLEQKKPWKSKTLWLNLLVAAGAMMPWAPVAEVMSEGNLVMVLSVVNMVLRLVSNQKIGLN